VASIVRDVEEICRKHGTTPDMLPSPSRLAYVFLKELDLDNLPVTGEENTAATPAMFRIKNVLKIGESFAEKFWQQLGPLSSSGEARAQIEREIGRQVSAIERICEQHGQSPSGLETPSRRVYCWLKFIGNNDNLSLHLEALQLARRAVDEQAPNPDRSIHVHLTGMNDLWRTREYLNARLIKVNEGFLNADLQVWRAISQNALSIRNQENDLLIREYAESDDFSELLFEIDSFAAATQSAAGRAYDLDESFARVNAAYFDGRMSRPALVWNRTLTAYKFGHYQPSRDTVMISVSLDDPATPAFVLDFVMYHELLHKKHGAIIANGRRLAHSPAFRADERRFTEFQEAKRLLHELAKKHRG
jgi:hypothetical protein